MTKKLEWKSPCKVEEEAIAACQEEFDNPDAIWTPDGCGA